MPAERFSDLTDQRAPRAHCCHLHGGAGGGVRHAGGSDAYPDNGAEKAMEPQSDGVAATDAAGNPVLARPTGEPRPGLYRHYKGGMYQVLGLVRHSETLDVLVLYKALYGTRGLWVRPRAMFAESVDHGGVCQPRFAWVSEAAPDSALMRERD